MRLVLTISLGAALTCADLSPAAADSPVVAADGSTTSVRRPSKADELFARGKERLAASDYAAACSLLTDSYQLDPATGSLLALATCHERQGKLATALHDYEEVVKRSRAENRPDREQAAQTQIVALHGKVSTLTLQIAHKPPDLSIRVNDAPVAKDELGRPMPMDGGFVVIEVEAKGRATWTKHVTLADSGDSLTLTIPSLGEAPATLPVVSAAAAAPVAASKAPPPPPARPKKAKFSPGEIAGIVLMGSSAIGAAVSIAYTAKAVHKNNESEDECENDLCTEKGKQARLDARHAGDVATAAVIATTVVASAGLVTFLVGRHRKHDRRQTAQLHGGGWLTGTSGGAAISGSF